MNKGTLKSILNVKSERFSHKELEEAMNMELSQPIDEIDTKMVERCLDALTVDGGSKSKIDSFKFNLSRIFSASVIGLVIFTLIYLAFR